MTGSAVAQVVHYIVAAGKALLLAAAIASLVGLARSVGFTVGLSSKSAVKVRPSRVLFDLVAAGTWCAIVSSQLVLDGAIDIGEIIGFVDVVIPKPWSLLVPAGAATLWLVAAKHSYRQAKRQPTADKDPKIAARALFNPDRVFDVTTRRNVDHWLVDEARELRSFVTETLFQNFSSFVIARKDVLSEITATSVPAVDARLRPQPAHQGHRRVPVAAVALLWVWALWRLPAILAAPVHDQLQVRALGGLVAPAALDRIPDWVTTFAGPYMLADIIVLAAVVLVALTKRGSILGNLVLRLAAITVIVNVAMSTLAQHTIALWQVLLVIPVIWVLVRLARSQDYRATDIWFGSYRPDEGRFRVVVRAIVVAAVATITVTWLAAESLPPYLLYRHAEYAAWTLAYMLGAHYLFLLFTHWRYGPLGRPAPGRAAIWTSILGFIALSFVLPARLSTSVAGPIVHLGDASRADARGFAQIAWLAVPMLAITGYTWAIIAKLLSTLGRFRVESYEADPQVSASLERPCTLSESTSTNPAGSP